MFMLAHAPVELQRIEACMRLFIIIRRCFLVVSENKDLLTVWR